MEYIANEEVGESLPHFFLLHIYIGINILQFWIEIQKKYISLYLKPLKQCLITE